METQILKSLIFFCRKSRKHFCFLPFLCLLSWLCSSFYSISWAADTLMLLKHFLTEENKLACWPALCMWCLLIMLSICRNHMHVHNFQPQGECRWIQMDRGLLSNFSSYSFFLFCFLENTMVKEVLTCTEVCWSHSSNICSLNIVVF